MRSLLVGSSWTTDKVARAQSVFAAAHLWACADAAEQMLRPTTNHYYYYYYYYYYDYYYYDDYYYYYYYYSTAGNRSFLQHCHCSLVAFGLG